VRYFSARRDDLENLTFARWLLLRLHRGARRRLEYFTYAVLRLRTALEIRVRTDPFRHCATVFVLNGLLLHLGELASRALIVTEILLVTYMQKYILET
jgi:hypothetical protein